MNSGYQAYSFHSLHIDFAVKRTTVLSRNNLCAFTVKGTVPVKNNIGIFLIWCLKVIFHCFSGAFFLGDFLSSHCFFLGNFYTVQLHDFLFICLFVYW